MYTVELILGTSGNPPSSEMVQDVINEKCQQNKYAFHSINTMGNHLYVVFTSVKTEAPNDYSYLMD